MVSHHERGVFIGACTCLPWLPLGRRQGGPLARAGGYLPLRYQYWFLWEDGRPPLRFIDDGWKLWNWNNISFFLFQPFTNPSEKDEHEVIYQLDDMVLSSLSFLHRFFAFSLFSLYNLCVIFHKCHYLYTSSIANVKVRNFYGSVQWNRQIFWLVARKNW